MAEEQTQETQEQKDRTSTYLYPPEEAKALCIKLKYDGVMYSAISEKTGVPESTLKDWFKVGGLLFERYNDYVAKNIDELEKEASIRLRREIWNAVAVINQTLQEKISIKVNCPGCKLQHVIEYSIPSKTRLRAAETVLDRTYGKSEQPINLKGNLSVYDGLTEQQIDELLDDLKDEQVKGGGGETGV